MFMIESESAATLTNIVAVFGTLMFCAFVQSAVGFAFSLFSNALLLLLTDIALPDVVMLSILASTLQRLMMTAQMRRHVDWRQTLPMSGISLLALPVGIFLLKFCSQQSVATVKISVGILVLLVLIIQLCWQVKPREHLAAGWGVLAALTSGLMGGLANIGGPPLVLWIHAHDWTNEKTRVTLMAITTVLVPVQIVLMTLIFKRNLIPTAWQLTILLPSVIAGTALGMAAGKRLSKPHLRAVALGLLTIIALTCIVEPLLQK
jgi:uncharacterized protein